MLSEYDEEIEKFLDDEAENYIPLEEKLLERGIDFETAVTVADKFRRKFNDMLAVKGIAKNNISQVCADIAELLKHDTGNETEFLYTAMLSEVFLLFGETEDNEQKVELWLEQSEKMYYLHTLFFLEKCNYQKIKDISKSAKSNTVGEVDLEEHKILYDTLMQYDIFEESYVLGENIGELIRQVNANNRLKQIKPYIYTAVLSRKTKKMTAQKGFIPNIKSIFKPMIYKIEKDNGKNFDRYQMYLELYDNLKRVYVNEMDTTFGHNVIVGYDINEMFIYDLTDRLIAEFQIDDNTDRDTFVHPFKSLNIWRLVFGTRATKKLLEVAKTNPMGVVSIMSSLFVDTDVHMTVFSTSTSREDITVLTSLESAVQQSIEMGNCDKLLIEPCGYVSRKMGVSRLTDLRPDLEESLLQLIRLQFSFSYFPPI